jgi:hypothetical protein
MERLVGAVLAGQVGGVVTQVDLLFIPVVLVVPAVTGALSAGRFPLWVPCVAWAGAGLQMAAVSWLVVRGDPAFHLGLTAVMTALTAVGWWLARLVLRDRPASGAA